MRLSDLSPMWLHPHLFAFLCPHCRQAWLTCKEIPMPLKEQHELFQRAGGIEPRDLIPTAAGESWIIDHQDFLTMTVGTSINAVGHWHGYITEGEVT